MKPIPLTENLPIRFSELSQFFTSKVCLSPESIHAVNACEAYITNKVTDSDSVIYGVNTGFGILCDTKINSEDLQLLQYNLIRSHACGVGNPIDSEIVRKMLFLKALGLAQGYSGVKLATIERLLYFYNNNLTPEVFEYGSLGASGDLAPLAHIALCMLGEGHFRIEGKRIPATQIFQEHNLKPVVLGAKEGIALLNGTQFMLAHLVHLCTESMQLWHASNAIAAASLDAYSGRIDAFDPRIQKIRNQIGQIETAKSIRAVLNDSELTALPKTQVQDPYSFRCIPQVHGASYDTIQYAIQIAEREWNGVTDNPNIFWETDAVISGGNFHGQTLAFAIDHLKLAIHTLGNISERRIYKLIDGTRGLPAFLTPNPGLNSGFMICQYTAAALVSASKQLCTPASADSIVSSNGQEDHVSMGANAAIQCIQILENVRQVLGIEWMTATQGLEFKKPFESSSCIRKNMLEYRKIVPFIEKDTILSTYLIISKEFITKVSWNQY